VGIPWSPRTVPGGVELSVARRAAARVQRVGQRDAHGEPVELPRTHDERVDLAMRGVFTQTPLRIICMENH
jgi:hypothetical protein